MVPQLQLVSGDRYGTAYNLRRNTVDSCHLRSQELQVHFKLRRACTTTVVSNIVRGPSLQLGLQNPLIDCNIATHVPCYVLMAHTMSTGTTNPEEGAKWWQKLTFSYANGLINLGYSQPLHQEHLWNMAKHNEASLVASRFQDALTASKDPVKSPHVSSPTAIMRPQAHLHMA